MKANGIDWVKAKAAEAKAAEAPAAKAVVLPIWPDAVRAVPNFCLRSALFGVVARGRRRFMEREKIATVAGIEILYTGVKLDQGDLDLWESMLHFARGVQLGQEVRVTAYQLLKLMGKSDTGGKNGNRDLLDKRMDRLRATALRIETERYSYLGGLVDRVAKDNDTKEYVIVFDPKLRPLFEQDQYTQLDWHIRQSLDGHPLAQWLHGFYATHAKPHPIKVETLHKLCGSETAEIWKFAQTLRKALDAVAEACTKNGQKWSYRIECNLIHVDKQGSSAQRRHIAKKVSAITVQK